MMAVAARASPVQEAAGPAAAGPTPATRRTAAPALDPSVAPYRSRAVIQRKCSCGGTCAACQEEKKLQRKASDATGTATLSGVDALMARSAGRPMEASTRSFMEPRFGREFGNVRVHTDAHAETAAKQINAHAFASGNDVYFAKGRYQPDTRDGQRLLAHELAHVTQQSAGRTAAGLDGGASDPLEQEADRAASHALSAGTAGGMSASIGLTPSAKGSAGGASIQRDADSTASSADSFEQQLDDVVSGLGATITSGSPSDAAYAMRLQMLLEGPRSGQFADHADYENFVGTAGQTARDELLTLSVLTPDAPLTDAPFAETRPAFRESPDVIRPEAFPILWSARLKANLSLDVDPGAVAELQKLGISAWEQTQHSADRMRDYIFASGLPVSFAESLLIQGFHFADPNAIYLESIGVGTGSPPLPGPLADYLVDGKKYIRAMADVAIVTEWGSAVNEVVRQVLEGEISVDPKAYATYRLQRSRGVPVSSVLRQAGEGLIPPALTGRVDPYAAERYVAAVNGLTVMGKTYVNAVKMTDLADAKMAEVDALIAGEEPSLRLARAQHWADEHDFYDASVEQIWKGIREHAGTVVKDVAIFTVIQFIPIVNAIADGVLAVQSAVDLVDAIADVAAKEAAARNATSAVALQRASAQLAMAYTSDGIRVAVDLLAVRSAAKAAKGVGSAIEKDVAGATKTAGKGATQAEKELANSIEAAGTSGEAKAVGKAALSGAEKGLEDAEVLAVRTAFGGTLRVTPRGRIYICHSPCAYVRDYFDAIANDIGRDKLLHIDERLSRLEQFADEAARSAPGGKMTRAQQKLIGDEGRLLHDEIGATRALGRPVSADELKYIGDHTTADDLARFHPDDPMVGQLLAQRGTWMHEQGYLFLRRKGKFPKDTLFTENTLGEFEQILARQNALSPGKRLPFANSSGPDLYVLNFKEKIVHVFDMTRVAGRGGHVSKAARDVDALRNVIGGEWKVADVIEVPWVGHGTSEEFGSAVADLLRGFAKGQ